MFIFLKYSVNLFLTMHWLFLAGRCLDQWFDVCDFLGCSLVSGDVEGNLDKLFGRVNTIQKKSGSFDVGLYHYLFIFVSMPLKRVKTNTTFNTPIQCLAFISFSEPRIKVATVHQHHCFRIFITVAVVCWRILWE